MYWICEYLYGHLLFLNIVFKIAAIVYLLLEIIVYSWTSVPFYREPKPEKNYRQPEPEPLNQFRGKIFLLTRLFIIQNSYKRSKTITFFKFRYHTHTLFSIIKYITHFIKLIIIIKTLLFIKLYFLTVQWRIMWNLSAFSTPVLLQDIISFKFHLVLREFFT